MRIGKVKKNRKQMFAVKNIFFLYAKLFTQKKKHPRLKDTSDSGLQ